MRLLLVLLGVAICCEAHNGPPFPIITDRPMSGCVVALWTHPDVGTGTFFVVVSPISGKPLPGGLRFEVGVEPVSGRLKEARYKTTESRENGQPRFDAAIPLDREEMWRVHLYSASSAGQDEAVATVMVTPPGLGPWDLLLYSLPFLGVGFLWFVGMQKKRKRRQGLR